MVDGSWQLIFLDCNYYMRPHSIQHSFIKIFIYNKTMFLWEISFIIYFLLFYCSNMATANTLYTNQLYLDRNGTSEGFSGPLLPRSNSRELFHARKTFPVILRHLMQAISQSYLL